jgi:hypothetical protein
MKIRRRPRKRFGVSIYLVRTPSLLPEGGGLNLRLKRIFCGTILAEHERLAAAKYWVSMFGQFDKKRIATLRGSIFVSKTSRFYSTINPYALGKRLTQTTLLGESGGYLLDNFTDVWLINVVEIDFPF